MRKRLLPLMLLLALLAVLPLTARAITPLEPNRKCSLKVLYAKDDHRFANVETPIYRIAQANPNGTFDLLYPYSTFGLSIHGIQSQREWDELASTLKSYLVRTQTAPDYTGRSDIQGTTTFTNLPTGLYLVLGNTAENDTGIYTFKDFFVYLPTPVTPEGFDYDMEVRPKPGQFVPKTEYTVKKLWKDTGYTSKRPKSVTVEIYKDAVLHDTVTLNSANNWSYTWKVVEDEGKWTVSEKNVSSDYKVTVSTSGNVFSITNTRKTASSYAPPAKTGDTFPIQYYAVVMCLSGVILLALGILRKRKRQ